MAPRLQRLRSFVTVSVFQLIGECSNQNDFEAKPENS